VVKLLRKVHSVVPVKTEVICGILGKDLVELVELCNEFFHNVIKILVVLLAQEGPDVVDFDE